ncbi:hypothetical protein GEMRC1_001135 [Eukaryota sp. GEM-RC1]
MSLFQGLQTSVRPLLDKIDNARSVLQEGNVTDINLPSIVVIGDQSAGKSSVVEALCELKFPKASGCCTRLPTIARLYNGTTDEPKLFAYSDKRQRHEVKLKDLDKTLTEMTNEIAGDQKNIVNDPIYVEIHKKGLYDLTLIDLPGLTRNPVRDQPQEIYEIVTEMYIKYIQAEETIIANVHPATMDIATSDSLRLSRKVDPQGIRTIGIFSQCDLAQRDIAPLITGESQDAIQLLLGFCAVVNPGENSEIDFATARANEERFFKSHQGLSKLSQDVLGIGSLARKLVEVQNRRVLERFPVIKGKIRHELASVKETIAHLSPPRVTPDATYDYFLHTVHRASEEFMTLTKEGTVVKELNVKARMHEVFEKGFDQLLKVTAEFRSKEMHALIELHVMEGVGHNLSNFLSSATFKAIFRQYFETHYKSVFSEVINRSAELVQLLMNHCWEKALPDHTNGCNLLKDVGEELVAEVKDKVLNISHETQEAELYDPYTVNHYYSDLLKRIEEELEDAATVPSLRVQGPGPVQPAAKPLPQTGNERQNSIMKYAISLEAYWKVVVKSYTDSAFKNIRYWFLKKLLDMINTEPQKRLSREVIFQTLKDEMGLEMKRRNLVARMDRLDQVYKILSS